MLARLPARRLALSVRRANYPEWKLDYSNFTNGEWKTSTSPDGSETVTYWEPTVKTVHRAQDAEWDNTNKKYSLVKAGLRVHHYENFFGLTAVGYVLFSLYDYRSEAQHAEAHGH